MLLFKLPNVMEPSYLISVKRDGRNWNCWNLKKKLNLVGIFIDGNSLHKCSSLEESQSFYKQFHCHLERFKVNIMVGFTESVNDAGKPIPEFCDIIYRMLYNKIKNKSPKGQYFDRISINVKGIVTKHKSKSRERNKSNVKCFLW